MIERNSTDSESRLRAEPQREGGNALGSSGAITRPVRSGPVDMRTPGFLYRRLVLLGLVAAGCVVCNFTVAFLAVHFEPRVRVATVHTLGAGAAERGWPEVGDQSWPPVDSWTLSTRPALRFVQARADDANGFPTHSVEFTEFGWPMASLTRVRASAPEDDLPAHLIDGRHPALRVAWLGTVVNVGVYFAAITMLFFGIPAMLRQFRAAARLRRGLCPDCAYPVMGSAVCPECGRADPARGPPAMRSMARRSVVIARLTLLVLIVIGCILSNFVIARAAARFDRQPQPAQDRFDGSEAALQGWPGPVDSSWPAPDHWSSSNRFAYRDVGARRHDADGYPSHIYHRTEYGWPMPTLVRVQSSFHDESVAGGLSAGDASQVSWTGTAANVGLYLAAIAFLVFGVPTMSRHYATAARLRRDLCLDCAYPLMGSAVCPKCGQSRSDLGGPGVRAKALRSVVVASLTLLVLVLSSCVVANFAIARAATRFDRQPQPAQVRFVGAEAALQGWPGPVDSSWPPPNAWSSATRFAYAHVRAGSDDADGDRSHGYQLTEYGWPMATRVRVRTVDSGGSVEEAVNAADSLRVSWTGTAGNVGLYFAASVVLIAFIQAMWRRNESRRAHRRIQNYPDRGEGS